MHIKMFCFIVINALFVSVFAGNRLYQDELDASQDPPGGLSVSVVPMFVCFGWDDNGFVDGVDWIGDLLRDRKNPQGNGNPATFDGTAVRMSFFMTSGYARYNDTLVESWKKIYADGHEIGNHTEDHLHGWGANWQNQLDSCNTYLKEVIGVKESEIYGFRSPFLEYTDVTHSTLVSLNFLYDCSVEHGNQNQDGTDFTWPYTLHNGTPASAAGSPVSNYPGLWELPVYWVLMPHISGWNKVTGFDWNLWDQKDLTGDQFFETLKHTLDLRMQGNRTPLLFGTHTDEYSEFNDEFNNAAANANCTQRKESVKKFVDYALSIPEVRIVPFVKIIEWMRNPVGLNDPTGVVAQVSLAQTIPEFHSDANNVLHLNIPGPADYTCHLYATNGKCVKTIALGCLQRGRNTINLQRLLLSSGIYIISLKGLGTHIEKSVYLDAH